jgi:hypothetical protein
VPSAGGPPRFRYSHDSDIPAAPEIVPSRPVSSLGDFGY